jgi:hypothetical protein
LGILGVILLRFRGHMTRFSGSYWSNLKLVPALTSSTLSKCQQNRLSIFIKIKITNNMSSRHSTPLENDNTASQVSSITSRSTLPNAFSRMMGPAPVIQSTAKRDRYTRPIPQYNHNYDLYKKPSNDLRRDYSPYIYGEPLYDDRPIIVARLPRYHTEAGAVKKPRTS